METLRLHLRDIDATRELGRILARGVQSLDDVPPLLLEGGLGAGKTTLVRALVEALPGADQAEVGSPSFNIMNLYPTDPEIAHFDLYRLEHMTPDDDLFDSFDAPNRLTIVEWAQYLDGPDRPRDALRLEWETDGPGGPLAIEASGPGSSALLEAIRPFLARLAAAGKQLKRDQRSRGRTPPVRAAWRAA